MFSRFRGPVLGCQPMMAPACVASRPGGVRGPGWFCLWALDLVELVWLVRSGQFFPERCLGGSGEGSLRIGLCCFCSPACCSVLSDGPCCLVVGLCILVKVLPRIALCRFWWRFFPGVLRFLLLWPVRD
ncbi:hypothetical protein Taro_024872 [Colocasia esculenta]|uniref:Uncharacterized protein n=1 Tax=Colocasia esculenta TaxID=4460 RepID=A0A843VLP1_COLES|nr:hypothetical protein [Colocasia esculenta]